MPSLFSKISFAAAGRGGASYSDSSDAISFKDVANPAINLANAGSMGQHVNELVILLNRAIKEDRLSVEDARNYATSAREKENSLGVYRLVGEVEGKTKIFVERRETTSFMSGNNFFRLDVRPFPIGDVAVPSDTGIKPNDVMLIAQHIPNSQYMGSTDNHYALNATTGQSWLCFKFDKSGALRSIYSPEDKQTMAALLVGLHQHAPDVAAKLFTLLSLPPLNQEMTAGYEKIARDEKAKKDKIAALTAHPIEYSPDPIDQNRTMGTLQGEYALTEAGNQINCLGGYGAEGCIIVLVRGECFDSSGANQSRGGAAHVDAMTDVASLDRIFQIMPAGAPVDVALVAAHGDPDTLLRLADYLERKPNIRSVKSDVSNGQFDAVLNIETGGVYATRPMNSGENEGIRMQLAGLKQANTPLKLSYDGTIKPTEPPAEDRNRQRPLSDLRR